MQALFQHPYTAALETLSKALGDKAKALGDEPSDERKELLFTLGLSQQRAGNVAAARATYRQSAQELQRELEKAARGSWQEAGLHADLGRAYAGLGLSRPLVMGTPESKLKVYSGRNPTKSKNARPMMP